jgi:hypothetical protein
MAVLAVLTGLTLKSLLGYARDTRKIALARKYSASKGSVALAVKGRG